MKYKAKFDDVYIAHNNAWLALFKSDFVQLTDHDLNHLYHETYKARLIKLNENAMNESYAFIEFDSEEDFLLYMLEWS